MSYRKINNSVVLASLASLASLFSSVFISASIGYAATNAGSPCVKLGQVINVGGSKLTCSMVRTQSAVIPKKVTAGSNSNPGTSAKETIIQSNARKSAANYLSMTGFSRSALISQLVFEQYSTADATYGVDAQHADWNKQAVRSAKSYLAMSSFSHSGLVDQLVFAGYSQAQAEFGVSASGL